MTLLQELINTLRLEWPDNATLRLLARLSINLFAVFILIRFIYLPNYKKTDLLLTFFAFNLIIFLITYLLNKVEMSMGAAFGLFAVFSMLRYRTEGISAKDMTYLFLVISIGLIAAISQNNWPLLAIFATLVLFVTFLLENGWLIKKEYSKQVSYENIRLVTPNHKQELLEDLKNRTGLDVHRVEIIEFDFLKDSAIITIYYY
ncbi:MULTISPECIES: DUF4956 domain-containing protein [Emticicia]|uniref:DUF4956 domain-containing protein n=1 Tax=Emticicia TaxID=312278 RepID=UPI00209F1EBF|nr:MULTISPECIES: DUF4956 domain-containing protein [Emticicia]UTA69786.1 DUF4956 domain-containing protein [Emticicia sp. 21SJ11W-3]